MEWGVGEGHSTGPHTRPGYTTAAFGFWCIFWFLVGGFIFYGVVGWCICCVDGDLCVIRFVFVRVCVLYYVYLVVSVVAESLEKAERVAEYIRGGVCVTRTGTIYRQCIKR